MEIFISLLLLLASLCVFLLIRNNELLEFRLKILLTDYDDYLKLPSYDVMLHCFWIPLDNIEDWENFKYPRIIERICNHFNI